MRPWVQEGVGAVETAAVVMTLEAWFGIRTPIQPTAAAVPAHQLRIRISTCIWPLAASLQRRRH